MAIAHVTLATRNVRRASQFFAATLGWRSIDRPNNIPMPAAWLEIAPGQELHLVEVPEFEPSPFEREYGRHLAVTYPKDGLTGLKERLMKEGASVIVPLRPTEVVRFFFECPDGYYFEVIAE